MAPALAYLHLVTPLILLLPLATLLPAPRPPVAEPDGIIPITIRKVTPRRGAIISLLVLLAITSILDTANLVGTFILRTELAKAHNLAGLNLAAWVVYAFGGFLLWSITTLVVEYRARWADKGVVTLAVLSMAMEIPNLVLLVVNLKHAGELKEASALTTVAPDWRLFYILFIPTSALRLVLLPGLLTAVANSRVTYEPADETSRLLGDSETEEQDDTIAGSSTPQTAAYGTFDNGKPAQTTTGASTPAANKPPLIIPKQLGELKTEDKPLEWRELFARVRKLSPHLWPSTSRRLQLHVLICIVLLLAGRVLQPLLPLSLGKVVKVLSANQGQQGNGASIWPPFILYFFVRIFMSGAGLIYFIRESLWIPVSQYTDREMMMLCFNHLLNLSLAYHTKRNTGEVLKVIDRGSAVNNLFQVVLFTAVPTILDIVIGFSIFFYLYGGLLALVSIAVMAVYVWVSVVGTRRRVVTRRLLGERDVKQRGIISDVLTNWESVKYFTSEQRESNRYREAVVSYQEMEAKWQFDYQFLYLCQSFLLSLGLLSGSLIIAHRILNGNADASEFITFVTYFQQLSSPLDRLGSLYQSLNRTSTDAEKMFNLLAQATEVNDKPGAKDLVVTDGVVEFDNVRFSYDGKVTALKGVSFKIDKGQSMALVGESGSGKSTILRLLYRFYDIDSGVIRIDGQDISQVTQLSLRRAIGIVPQDSVLWNDSIGANISYGKEGATDEEIILAAQRAKLHERILGFAEQYSTVVGERGVRLSGGEKQRVSLARMFLKSPAILVLDEATSALDTTTEREIQKSLSELAKGRSSLSIAHRLSTIINSDQIVVMKDGEVIENGAYKELLELNGTFASMWKKQIFTEAEMVAQANGSTAEPDLIQLEEEVKEEGSTVVQPDDKPDDGADDAGDAEPVVQGGFDVPSTVDEDATKGETAISYADAVKISPEGGNDSLSQQIQDDIEQPSIEAEGATVPLPQPTETPRKTPGEVRPTPEKRVSFPQSRNLPTSESQSSNLSDFQSSETSSTPQRSSSQVELASTDSTPGSKDKGKSRKRLDSLKGFVRRISDQNVNKPLSRSNSTHSATGAKSPMGEPDESTALIPAGKEDKKKKRLSLKK